MGAAVAALVGLMPACGSDSGGKPGGGILDGGGTGASGGAGPSSGGGSNAGASGSGAGTGAGGSGTTGLTPIGQACLRDTDCGTQGLKCLLPTGTDFAGGGVANGLCTLDCTAFYNAASQVTTANPCAAIDANAICLGVTTAPTQAFCVESCTIGPVPSTVTKCHARRDMACADPMSIGQGFCQPTCRGDFDCPTPRVCDLGAGTCTDPISASRNLPLGSKCDPTQGAVDTCHAACVGVLEGDSSTTMIGFCSGSCKLGEVGCGVDPTSKAPTDAYCLFPAENQGDSGDLGFCAELCDCNDDCKNSDFLCNTVTGLKAQIGRVGACGPKSSASASEPNGIPCTATKPPPKVDSGTTTKPPPVVDAGAPDAP